MVRVKNDFAFPFFKVIKSFSDCVQNNCSAYSLYRCLVHADGDNNIYFKFLCVNINGSFAIKEYIYLSESDSFCSPKKDIFTNDVVYPAMVNLVNSLSMFSENGFPISCLFFDIAYASLKPDDCTMGKDPNEEGSYKLYVKCSNSNLINHHDVSCASIGKNDVLLKELVYF